MRVDRLAVPVLVVCVACSSNSNVVKPSDAGTTDTGGGGGGTVTDQGVIVDYDLRKGLAGVTVTEGAASTTTDAAGKWSLAVPPATPVLLTLSRDGFITESYPEASLSKDTVRPDIALVPTSTYQLLTGSLQGFDSTHGLLYVEVEATGACADLGGATVRFANPGTEVLRYVYHSIPRESQKAIDANETPVVALFYNAALETQLDLVFENTTCTLQPFPHTDEATGITYTGTVKIHGEASTIARYFFK